MKLSDFSAFPLADPPAAPVTGDGVSVAMRNMAERLNPDEWADRGFWRTAAGQLIQFSQLQTDHLHNIWVMIRNRHMYEWPRAYRCIREEMIRRGFPV